MLCGFRCRRDEGGTTTPLREPYREMGLPFYFSKLGGMRMSGLMMRAHVRAHVKAMTGVMKSVFDLIGWDNHNAPVFPHHDRMTQKFVLADRCADGLARLLYDALTK